MVGIQTPPDQRQVPEAGLWLRLGGAFTVLMLLLTCFYVGTWLSRGREHDSRLFPVQGDHIVVDLNGGGDLRLSTGKPGGVLVDSEVTWSLSRPKMSWTYDAGVLHLETADYLSPFGHFSRSFSVLVPPSMSVDVRSGSGDISAVDLAGDLKLETGSGAVTVFNATGRLELKDGSGDIFVSGASSSVVNAHTGSGDVHLILETAPVTVDAATGSGDLTVEVPAGTRYQVRKETHSGSTGGDVSSYPQAANTISATTSSGSVTVSYRAPFTPRSGATAR